MKDPLTQYGYGHALSQDFLLRVGMGLIPGFSIVNKFGRNPDIDTATDPETIWSQGGLYTYLAAAATLYVTSTDDTDTHEITVEGLDATWALQTATVNLTGQTQAEIGSGLTWIRVFRAYNSDATPTLGDVYIAEQDTDTGGVPDTASKIKAKIDIYAQQTLMALYTVPLGKTAMTLDGYYTLNKSGATAWATCSFFIREFGGVFRLKRIVGVQSTGSSIFNYRLPLPRAIPAKSDIAMRVTEVSANDMDISAGLSILLIDD